MKSLSTPGILENSWDEIDLRQAIWVLLFWTRTLLVQRPMQVLFPHHKQRLSSLEPNCEMGEFHDEILWESGLRTLLFSRSVMSNSLQPPATHQVPLSFTISQNLLKLLSIESVMPPNHLVLCHPLLLLPSLFPSIVSNELALCIRWPKYWSFSISPSNEYSELISFQIDWCSISLLSKGLSRVFSKEWSWETDLWKSKQGSSGQSKKGNSSALTNEASADLYRHAEAERPVRVTQIEAKEPEPLFPFVPSVSLNKAAIRCGLPLGRVCNFGQGSSLQLKAIPNEGWVAGVWYSQ